LALNQGGAFCFRAQAFFLSPTNLIYDRTEVDNCLE
jgi:hypothetical protein